MQVWLFKMYQRNPLGPTWETTPYAKLIQSLNGNALGSRATVLTTNYDLVLESFAWKGCLRCTYGLRDSEPIRIRGGVETYLADDSDASAPLVCKLHGSINYFANPNSPDPGKLLICDDVQPTGGRVTNASNVILGGASRPSVLNFDAVAMLRSSSFGPKITPQIIPPTYAKLQDLKWLRCIWSNAFEALKSAKKIIFIGYSMPESDGHLRAMIQAAMAARTLPEPPEVHVFDPTDQTLCRYSQLFQPLEGRKLRLWKMSFEEAVQGRLPDILTT